MALFAGTKFKLHSFIDSPVWLEGAYGADLRNIHEGLKAMVRSPLLEWMFYFLYSSTQVEVKMASYDGACCLNGRWHDINNYNYSVVWRLLCHEIIGGGEASQSASGYLRALVRKWPSLHPNHQSKSNRERQGDIFEAMLSIWRKTDIERWHEMLGGDLADVIVAVRDFHDGLHSLCLAVERLTNVFEWTPKSEQPSANVCFALVDKCIFVHMNTRTTLNAKGANKHAARVELYKHVLSNCRALED